jgi:glutathione S-transferase
VNVVELKLVTGSRNVSSWTFRTWIVMRQFDLPFEDVEVALNQPGTAASIARHSPSGRIPCLIMGDQVVWDSLSICETLAERFPDLALWPRNARRRAHARSICAELHAGFTELRRTLPFDLLRRDSSAGRRALVIPAVAHEVQRIVQILDDCLTQYEGPFLFGDFTIADAYFIPTLLRLRSYALPILSPAVADYRDRIECLESVREWTAQAARERRA